MQVEEDQVDTKAKYGMHDKRPPWEFRPTGSSAILALFAYSADPTRSDLQISANRIRGHFLRLHNPWIDPSCDASMAATSIHCKSHPL